MQKYSTPFGGDVPQEVRTASHQSVAYYLMKDLETGALQTASEAETLRYMVPCSGLISKHIRDVSPLSFKQRS